MSIDTKKVNKSKFLRNAIMTYLGIAKHRPDIAEDYAHDPDFKNTTQPIGWGTTRVTYKNLGHDILFWDGPKEDGLPREFTEAQWLSENIWFVPGLDEKFNARQEKFKECFQKVTDVPQS